MTEKSTLNVLSCLDPVNFQIGSETISSKQQMNGKL